MHCDVYNNNNRSVFSIHYSALWLLLSLRSVDLGLPFERQIFANFYKTAKCIMLRCQYNIVFIIKSDFRLIYDKRHLGIANRVVVNIVKRFREKFKLFFPLFFRLYPVWVIVYYIDVLQNIIFFFYIIINIDNNICYV